MPSRRRFASFAVLAAAGALASPWAFAGEAPAWAPPELVPVATTCADVAAAIDRHRGTSDADYRERLTLRAGPLTLAADARVSGTDVRYTVEADGRTFTMGRTAGRRWRRTPAGLIHDADSDLQGDAFDRWPVSVFPFDAADCQVAGETRGTRPAWVVRDAPRRAPVHWFFVDERTGRIDRETTREGAAVYTTSFADERRAAGALRPFHWTTSGFGGDVDVTVESVTAGPVSADETSVPASLPLDAAFPAGGTVRLSADVGRNGIVVDATVNGRHGRFLLDTGTPQILLSDAMARRSGVATVFSYGEAARLETGGLRLTDVPLMTVPTIFGLDGILGYDFFTAGIVHIDEARGIAEVLRPDRFTPPASARAIPVSYAEGLPLVAATIGPFAGARVALDTGSADVFVPRYLWAARGLSRSNIIDRLVPGPPRADRFLEGPVDTRVAAIGDLIVGGIALGPSRALVEEPDPSSIDVPFDAIFGNDVLARFAWWFDYRAGKAWAVPVE